jgi:hypothetical protein
MAHSGTDQSIATSIYLDTGYLDTGKGRSDQSQPPTASSIIHFINSKIHFCWTWRDYPDTFAFGRGPGSRYGATTWSDPVRSQDIIIISSLLHLLATAV